MIEDIVELLKLFASHVPDPETNGWVSAVASDESRWREAHDYFDRIRKRNVRAISDRDEARQAQYCFEEACLKSLWNETDTDAPFDSDSPYSIIPCAFDVARTLGIDTAEVITVVTS